MDRVDPINLFEPLSGIDIQVDHHGFVVAAHQHAFERCIAEGIDLLVRNVRRHENEVAGFRLCGEFELEVNDARRQ